MLFEKRPAKLSYLSDHYYYEAERDEEDLGVAGNETDRLPRELLVTRLDLLCFLVSIASYLADVISDVIVAVAHITEHRYYAGGVILLLAVLPSLVLNTVSFMWLLDDEARRRRRSPKKPSCAHFALWKALVCIAQAGPLIWYLRALYYGARFRGEKNERKRLALFCRMIESERDATLLRFFEAFLESAPQLLVQAYLIADFLWFFTPGQPLPRWVLLQFVSITLSLCSMCWSITVQHRTLRMARPDKVNMHPHESFMQLIWRISTVSSRLGVFILCLLAFRWGIVALIGSHFVISLIHIAAMQSVDSGHSVLETALLLINACVHTWTPFNMAEGQTRYRYVIAYLIEAIEAAVIVALTLPNQAFAYPYKLHLSVGVAAGFVIGVSTMIVYYSCFHPNRRRHLRLECVDGAGERRERAATKNTEAEAVL